MIKRPLNPQFSSAVIEGRKFTTIREKAWPVGVPIMLYTWSGDDYRPKPVDVAVVVANSAIPITITHLPSGQMLYDYYGFREGDAIWVSEGFDNGHDMDEWFRPMVKRGESLTKHLMRFHLLNVPCPPTGATEKEVEK